MGSSLRGKEETVGWMGAWRVRKRQDKRNKETRKTEEGKVFFKNKRNWKKRKKKRGPEGLMGEGRVREFF